MLSLLHFGQCILFICDTVYPKIVIIRQYQITCEGIYTPLVLAVTIMLNHQTIVKLLMAITAGIAGMLFGDSQYQIINNHNERYTKSTLAKQDQQHFKCIPFARLKQRDPYYGVTTQ
jgi:hypothetical protein